MELIPAVDLRGGRVVRLAQGDFARETDYGDPAAMIERWVGEGAGRLHLVDLDGARAGRSVQAELFRGLIADAGVPCQVAGGLRSDESVDAALTAGADRVVLGSGLLADPAWAGRLVARIGRDRLVAALDVRDGQAVAGAWVPGAGGRDALQAARLLQAAGVVSFVVTAVERDGLMAGPDLELLEGVAAVVGAGAIVASGGIGSLADLRALAHRGYGGAILGRALYEGHIHLGEALAAVS